MLISTLSELIASKDKLSEGEIVKKYCELNPTPDQECCPNLICTFSGNNKKLGEYTKYYYPKDGRTFINEYPDKENLFAYYNTGKIKNNNVLVKAKKDPYYGVYTKFIKGLDMIEISKVKLEGGRPDKKINTDIRLWKYEELLYNNMSVGYVDHNFISRTFLFKNNFQPYSSSGERLWSDRNRRYYNDEFCWYLKELHTNNYINSGNQIQQFRLFAMGTTDITYEAPFYGLRASYEWNTYYKNMVPRKSKTMDKINSSLSSSSIKTLDELISKYHVLIDNDSDKYKLSSGKSILSPIIYEKINNDSFMFRILDYNDSSLIMPLVKEGQYELSPLPSSTKETGRIIIDTKANTCIQLINTGDNKFIKKNLYNYWNCYIENIEDMVKDNKELYDLFINYANKIGGSIYSSKNMKAIVEIVKERKFIGKTTKYPNITTNILFAHDTPTTGKRVMFSKNRDIKNTESFEEYSNANNYQLLKLEKNLANNDSYATNSFNNRINTFNRYCVSNLPEKNRNYIRAYIDLIAVYQESFKNMTNEDFDSNIKLITNYYLMKGRYSIFTRDLSFNWNEINPNDIRKFFESYKIVKNKEKTDIDTDFINCCSNLIRIHKSMCCRGTEALYKKYEIDIENPYKNIDDMESLRKACSSMEKIQADYRIGIYV